MSREDRKAMNLAELAGAMPPHRTPARGGNPFGGDLRHVKGHSNEIGRPASINQRIMISERWRGSS